MPAEAIKYSTIRTGPERPRGVPEPVAELVVQTRILLGILRRRYFAESEEEDAGTQDKDRDR